MPPTTSAARATTASTPPRMSVRLDLAGGFFREGRSSSSSAAAPFFGEVLPLATAADLPPLAPGLAEGLVATLSLPFFFFAGASSTSSSSGPSAAGSSTTKRYLHLGQSIFLPISCGSRTGTIASQLGHICLKLFGTVAISGPASARNGSMVREVRRE